MMGRCCTYSKYPVLIVECIWVSVEVDGFIFSHGFLYLVQSQLQVFGRLVELFTLDDCNLQRRTNKINDKVVFPERNVILFHEIRLQLHMPTLLYCMRFIFLRKIVI